MKILIVRQYYYPDDFRINEISFSLVKAGHEVTVLTGLPDYSTGKVPKPYRWHKKRKETINGVKVVRVFTIARRNGLIFRILNYISFMINSTVYSMFLNRDFDVIFSYMTSPITMAHAAVKMRRRTGKKLFLYCLDLWPESLKAWNIRENSFAFKIMKKYSRWIYQNCDLVGITSMPFKEYLITTNHVDAAKIVYLPQHADEVNTDISRKESTEGVVNFAFAGNIGKVQDVECIVRAVSHLRDIDNFAVHVFGNGTNLDSCINLSQELQVENSICFHGRVDREQLFRQYIDMDAFLLTLKQEGYIGSTIPGKLQEYMSFGKPIIAAIDGASASLIQEAECGLVTMPSDDIGLAVHMREFILNSEKYTDLGMNGYNYYRENFTKESFMVQLEEILKSLC